MFCLLLLLLSENCENPVWGTGTAMCDEGGPNDIYYPLAWGRGVPLLTCSVECNDGCTLSNPEDGSTMECWLRRGRLPAFEPNIMCDCKFLAISYPAQNGSCKLQKLFNVQYSSFIVHQNIACD